jgi:hypothetical protein
VDVSSYLTFLLFGVVLIALDGQLIYRSGRTYLAEVYDPRAARSVNRLIGVLFYLVVLGLFALVSTIDVRMDNPAEGFVVKLGIVLLLIAAAHGSTMIVLSRIRHRQREEGLAEEITEQVEERMHGEPSVHEARDHAARRYDRGGSAPTEKATDAGGTKVEVHPPTSPAE